MRKKLKAILAVIVGAFAFIMVGATATVSAEATTFYDALSDTNTSYLNGATIKTNDDLTLENVGVSATVVNISVSNYTKSLVLNGNGSNEKYFKLTAKNKVEVTIDFCDTSSSKKLQAKSYTIGSFTGTTAKEVNTVTETIQSGSSILIYSDGRMNIFKITYETVAVDTTVYTATFNLGTVTSGTKVSDITVSKEAASKTITLPTTDAVKNKYVFAGWNDGTTTYDAGTSYELTSDVNFTAVWNLDVSYGDNYILNASDNTTGSEENIVDGTIYKFTSSITVDGSKATIDGFSFTKRYKLAGTGSIASNSILIKVPSKGTLRVYGMSSKSGSTRTLGLYDSSYVLVNDKFSNDGSAIGGYSFELSDAGDYYLGSTNSAFNVYYVEFVAYETPVALQQEATSGDYTYVRFITKITGVADVTISEATKLVFTMTYADNSTKEVDYTSHMYIADAIKNNSEDYTATVNDSSYTFANHTCEYYVVCVVRLTTSKFNGCKIHATLTYGGNTYTSTDGTIGNAQ